MGGGGGRGEKRILKGITVLFKVFQNSVLKSTENQASQGILSTIVETLEIDLIPVVQKVYNVIHRINHYPLDNVVC